MNIGTILGFFIAFAVAFTLMGSKARGDPAWEAGFLFTALPNPSL